MKYTIGTILLLLTTLVNATSLDKQTDAKALSDKMIAHFVSKEFKEGLALAKQHWPLPEVEIDNLANQINTQWPIVDQRFGSSTGHEFIRTEKIGNSFVRYYYLHKFQNHAIYWRFSFYKPSKTWVVNEVTFMDSLEPLFEVVK